MSRLLRSLEGSTASDHDYDEDDDEELEAHAPPAPITLVEAAKKAKKDKKIVEPAAEKKPVHHNDNDEEQRVECAALQRDQIAALESRWGKRVRVVEQAGSRIVRVKCRTATVQLILGPLCPVREGVFVQLLTEASHVHPATAAAVREPAKLGDLVAFLDAVDAAAGAANAQLAEVVAAATPRTAADLVLTRVPADEPLEFFGQLVHAEPFACVDPFESTGESCTLVGTQLFAIGGASINNDAAPLPLVRVLDLAARTRTWRALDTDNFPPRLLRHAAVCVGDEIFVFGGDPPTQKNLRRAVPGPCEPGSARILNLKTLVWSRVPAPYSASLAHLTATRMDKQIVLVGGSVVDPIDGQFGTVAHLYFFDFANRCFRPSPQGKLNWASAVPALPVIREHTATRVGESLVFLAGGLQDATVSGRAFVLNTSTLELIQVGEQTRPRAAHAALRVGDRGRLVALVGGRSLGAAVNDVDLFDLANKTWHTRAAPEAVGRLGGHLLPFADGRCLSLGGFFEFFRDPGGTLDWQRRKTTPSLVAHRSLAVPVIINVGLTRSVPRSTLGATLLALLDSGSFSDLEFRGFRLHRVVLQARCPALLEQLQRGEVRSVEDICDDESFGDLFRFLYGDVPIEGVRLRGVMTNTFHFDLATTVQASLGALFDDDEQRAKYADVTFEAGGGETLRVHRLFASRAAHFERALGAGMREAQTGTIRVDDVEPASLRALLRFLYTDELKCDAEHAVEVLALADRCQLEALKKHAELLVESSYDFSELANVVELVDIAQRYSADHLRRAALNVLVSDFPQAAVLEHLADAQDVAESAAAAIRTAFFES